MSRAGQVVSREELQQRLWNGNTFVDFENGLNTAVNKLRQALGDSADDPRYVETVPGRGYRFVGILDREHPRPVLEIPPPAPQPEAKPSRYPIPLLAGLLAAGIAGGWFAASWRSRPAAASHPRVRFTVSPPPGLVMHPPSTRQSFVLSPDGTHLAFSAMNAGGGYELFIRDLNSLESRRVPNSAGAYSLFWSPDSRSLLFTVQAKLRRTPIDGSGGQQIIGDVPSFFFGGTFLDNERLLVGGRRFSGVLPVSGGTLSRIQQDYSWPNLLPDGKHILDATYGKDGKRRVRITRLGENAPVRELMETHSRVEYAPSMSRQGKGYLLYVRGGNLLAHPFDPDALRTTGEPVPIEHDVYTFAPSGAANFSVSRNGVLAYQTIRGRSQLAWVDREGKILSAITPGNLGLRNARISPDGRFVASPVYDVERGAVRMWLFEADGKGGRLMADGDQNEESPVWSQDSRALVYNAAMVTPGKLYLRTVDGNKPDEALPHAFFQTATDWSADGRYVAFGNTGFGRAAFEDNGDVLVVDMTAKPERKIHPLLVTGFHEANAVWSPDGRWLAFTSNESGNPEIYLQRFEAGDPPKLTGERFPVTRNGAQSIRWRRDGREMFYLALDGKVHAMPVVLGERPRFGEPKALFTISAAARAAIHAIIGFDVSPDGRRFVIPVVTSLEDPPIVVVQNWEP